MNPKLMSFMPPLSTGTITSGFANDGATLAPGSACVGSEGPCTSASKTPTEWPFAASRRACERSFATPRPLRRTFESELRAGADEVECDRALADATLATRHADDSLDGGHDAKTRGETSSRRRAKPHAVSDSASTLCCSSTRPGLHAAGLICCACRPPSGSLVRRARRFALGSMREAVQMSVRHGAIGLKRSVNCSTGGGDSSAQPSSCSAVLRRAGAFTRAQQHDFRGRVSAPSCSISGRLSQATARPTHLDAPKRWRS